MPSDSRSVLPDLPTTDAENPILVALSGGADSCALLLYLFESCVDRSGLFAAHFHHGLRGRDADEDAAFAASLCAKLGIPCVVGLGAVKPEGRSPNAAARDDRYAFLIEMAREWNIHRIATAHTKDDQAETVLLRALRGTSLDGLVGIPASRDLAPGIRLIRPLLPYTRAQTEAKCAEYALTPRQDPSNTNDHYDRARIRKLLPTIATSFNPRVTDALERLADQAHVDTDLLNELADDLLKQVLLTDTPDNTLELHGEKLTDAHPALRRRVLLRALRQIYIDQPPVEAEKGTTYDFVLRLDEALLNAHGAHDLPGGVRAVITKRRRQPGERGPRLMVLRLTSPLLP